ncbi:thioredoxin family protein [Hanstruepera flava]|uniref:thioredoxin family protein n=1 Tax=Hanstruepera flava TaxID=2930218 RepID=UPI002028ACA7|nr:thioredoxin family protein [Hanstruepera flava]
MKQVIFILALMVSFGSVRADNWLTSFEEAQKLALGTNKLILVDFWATWCGPCKRMDSESWSKDEVHLLMDNYVPVKIDIDKNRALAQKYGVNGIPFIFIMDGNGKVVYKEMSYKRKSEVIRLLEKYALNTSYLSKDLINYYKNTSFTTAFRLGVKYQDYSLHLGDSIQKDILTLSTSYLEDAEAYLKESKMKNKKAFKQKITLFKIQETLILNKPDKALKQLGKIKEESLEQINVELYSFLYYVAYLKLGDDSNISKWRNQISEADIRKADLFIETS